MGNITTAKAITFLDIETTHLDNSKSAILSISIITDWDGGKQDVWTTKIKPKDIEMQFASKEALEVCMYNEEEWADAPSFKDVAPEIAKRLMWGPLVAHNIQFDIGHIRSVFKRYGVIMLLESLLLWLYFSEDMDIEKPSATKELKTTTGFIKLDILK